ncbi:MAG: hypothetical protein JWM96_745 [Alphaproteobacteria bacterium]|nr:hypothetical protein [Alphaproteobacteria bacterium]
MLNFLLTDKQKRAKALQEKLDAAKRPSGDLSVTAVVDLYKTAYDRDTVDALIAQKPKKGVALEAAKLMKEIDLAKTALKNRDIGPAVAKIEDGSPLNIFEEIVSDTSNPHALEARLAVMPLLAKKGRGDGQGDYNCAQAGKQYGHEAIKAYSKDKKSEECQAALVALDKNFSPNSDGTYADYYLEEFRKGDPELFTAGEAALKIVKTGRRSTHSLSLPDNIAILKFHSDDQAKVQAIKEIAVETQNMRNGENVKKSFHLLLDHVKTKDGQAKPSQQEAIKTLVEDFHHMTSPYNGEENPEADKFYGVIIDELQHGNRAVLQEVFDTPEKTHRFLTDYSRYKSSKSNNTEYKITDLLPPELEGEEIDGVRNHFAQQKLKTIAPVYMASDRDRVFNSGIASYASEAREAATLCRIVLSGSSQKAHGLAEAGLKQLVLLEDSKKKLDQNALSEMRGDLQNSSHSYIELAEKHIEQTQDKIGYGRAALDVLKYNGTQATIAVADRIAAQTSAGAEVKAMDTAHVFSIKSASSK